MYNLEPSQHIFRVLTYKKIFSPEECQKIINIKGEVLPAPVYSEDTSKDNSPEKFPNCRAISVGPETAWLFSKLQKVIDHANNNFYKFDIVGVGDTRLNEYKNSKAFEWHVDLGGGNSSTRKLSVVILLSNKNDFKGGELNWYGIKQDLDQEQGTVILFPPYILHKVEPVTEGVRYTLVSWVHGPHFR